MRIPLKTVLRELNRRGISFALREWVPGGWASEKEEEDAKRGLRFWIDDWHDKADMAEGYIRLVLRSGILQGKNRSDFFKGFARDFAQIRGDYEGAQRRLYNTILSKNTSDEQRVVALRALRQYFLKRAEDLKGALKIWISHKEPIPKKWFEERRRENK